MEREPHKDFHKKYELMTSNYQRQIDLYEDIIRKNEKEMDMQLREINLSLNTRLELENRVGKYKKQMQALHEEIHLLQQDKKDIQVNSNKLQKMLYGPGKRPSRM